jgi:hypothetical protein
MTLHEGLYQRAGSFLLPGLSWEPTRQHGSEHFVTIAPQKAAQCSMCSQTAYKKTHQLRAILAVCVHRGLRTFYMAPPPPHPRRQNRVICIHLHQTCTRASTHACMSLLASQHGARRQRRSQVHRPAARTRAQQQLADHAAVLEDGEGLVSLFQRISAQGGSVDTFG